MKCYTGPRGSGKTSHAVSDVLEKLSYRRQHNVVANFNINFRQREITKKSYDQKFFFVADQDMTTPQPLIELSAKHGWYKKEGQTLLVIDEAGIKFNARDWNAKPDIHDQWIRFFVNSRKLGYEPVLVSQTLRMIDRQIRDLVEIDVKHAKMNNLHWLKYLPIPVYVTLTRWLIGDFKPQVKFHVMNPFQRFRYDTMKLFDSKIIDMINKYQVEEPSLDPDEGVRGPADGTGGAKSWLRFLTAKPIEGKITKD